MTHFPFATVGFDLDGTLLDTSGDLAAAVNHALTSLGREPLPVERIRPMIGGGARHMLEQAMTATGAGGDLDAALDELLAYYEAHMTVHTRPFPQVVETLDALRALGVTLACVTNKREHFTLKLLTALGLRDRFACVIGGDTLGEDRAKPKPDMLLAMLDRCAGPAAFVGDSIYDVQAARAAGLPVVACAFGYRQGPVEELGADAVIDSFAELIPTLRRLRPA